MPLSLHCLRYQPLCTTAMESQLSLRLCTTVGATDLRLWDVSATNLATIWIRNLIGILGGPPSINDLSRQFLGWVDLTSQLYALSTMRIDVDTPHQPHNTATIALCTYLATSGTVEHADLQLLESQSDSTVAIQRPPYSNVSLTILQCTKLRCDHHVVASHGPCLLYTSPSPRD